LLSCFCTAETKQQQRDDDDDANIVRIVLVRGRISKRRKDQERRSTKGGTRLRNYFIQKRSLAALFEGILMDRKNEESVHNRHKYSTCIVGRGER
jgi:hypothetical protein